MNDPLAAPADRAVNPVLGVLLVVGLTVVCSAALGTVLIGGGDDAERAPAVDATVEVENVVQHGSDGFVTLGVTALDDADSVTVTATTADGTPAIVDGTPNGTAELIERRDAVGESVTVREAVDPNHPRDVELRLVAVARHGDREAVVLDRTVIV